MGKISECFSVGFIMVLGFIANLLFNKIRVPGLVGMILIGIIIGPEVLSLICNGILNIASELRTMGLIIIMCKTGLNLDLDSLKKIGRPAILISFLPATFEIIGVMLSSKWLLDFSYSEGLLMGAILGAVSPAVVSIRMFRLIEQRYGEEHGVPKLILAGSSIDDIYTIILFYAFISLVLTSSFNAKSLAEIPISIGLGVILGLLVGIPLCFIFKKINFTFLESVVLLFGVDLLLDGFEHYTDYITEGTKVDFISASGLLSVILIGVIILYKMPEKAKELSKGYDGLWAGFEYLLFVLVGSSIKFDKEFVHNLGPGIGVLFIGLIFRSAGVYVTLIGTQFEWKEKLFIILANIPKATVQASIGGIPAAKGVKSGNIINAIAVLSIIISAPIGALCIDLTAPYLLKKSVDDTGKKDIKFIEENSINDYNQDEKNSKENDKYNNKKEIQKDNQTEKNINEETSSNPGEVELLNVL